MASLCPPSSYWPSDWVIRVVMKKFNWAVVGFGFDRQGDSFKLQIEEAEDSLSSASMLLKQARANPQISTEEVDEALQDIASAQDKVRKIRSDSKGL